jgi:hypothetical protein
LIVTEHCFVGEAFYSGIQNGDIATVLLGHSVPVILRPVEDHFEYIRELYLDGIMYGEAMKVVEDGFVELRDFASLAYRQVQFSMRDCELC